MSVSNLKRSAKEFERQVSLKREAELDENFDHQVTISRFAHLEKLSLNFSRSSLQLEKIKRVNLLHL